MRIARLIGSMFRVHARPGATGCVNEIAFTFYGIGLPSPHPVMSGLGQGFKRNAAEAVEIIVMAEQIIFSPVVMGELMFGFRNGTRFKENMNDLNRFLEHEAVGLVPIGKITSDRYSRIAVKLREQGTPIPTNDIWIAAQAMEQGAELITSDKHFDKINGLVHTIF